MLVSALGFGMMRLPSAGGGLRRDDPADKARVEELVSCAIGNGINYFDTAYPYHHHTSEAALGQALEHLGIRRNVIVATKLPSKSMDSPESWAPIFAEQLADLRTDYVDVYLVHNLNRKRWKSFTEGGGLAFLENLKRQGKVRALGFSMHDDTATFRTILDGFDWDMCQIQFNFLDVDFQAGLAGYQYAVEKNVPVVSMETLKGGMLAKEQQPEAVLRVWEQENLPRRSPAEWALRWVLDHAGISVALSGMHAEEEIVSNARIADSHPAGTLNASELAAFESVRQVYRASYPVQCTGCGYCQPCPQHVDIPYVFQLYNQYAAFGDKRWARVQSSVIETNGIGPSGCVRCGRCEKLCPQGLPIADELARAREAFSAL